ncbi:MAG: ROK family protein [Candidatus Competibacteraceae bacterium]|nr:ROK family protein [Candidatus Competibacteraceae bacterium]
MSLLDLNGNVHGELRFKLEFNRTAAEVSSLITDGLDNLLAQVGRSRSSVLAMGSAMPGPLGLDTKGQPKAVCEQYGQVIDTVKENFKCSTMVIDSNTNMAAVAELTTNQISDGDLVLVIRIGHAIRTALLVDGNILRGSGGLAGELGHIRIPSSDLPCTCGAIGCINTVASIGAIIDRCRATGTDVKDFDDLVELCRSGNQDARRVVMQAGEAVGYGLAAAISLVAPHVVIVSGPAIMADEFILGPLRDAVREVSIAEIYNGCRIIAGCAANNAECYGAGLRALREVQVMDWSLLKVSP